MKNFKQFNLLLALLFFAFSPAKAIRNINISGIIMDSENLSPVENAKIYDDSEKLLGTTDAKGFFKISFLKDDKGEVFFKLKVKKEGYEPFIQNEHWGDLSDDINATFYFGIKNKSSKNTKAFSELGLNGKFNTYEEVSKGIEKISGKIDFDKKIEAAKKDNENVFFQMGNRFFIISDTGWVEIKSGDENILVDNKNSIKAKELNGTVKRSKIKRMTTLNQNGNVAGIFTKN